MMLVDAMNREFLGGAFGMFRSLTSLRVTPLVSPWPAVEEMTPSNRWLVAVTKVTVVP